jgi:competence protein ComFC
MDIQGLTLNRLKKTTKSVAQSFGHLLWPAQCMSCRESPVESGGDLCSGCWEGIISVCGAQYCQRCGRDAGPYAICDGVCSNCRDEQIHFDGIARAGVYAETLRRAILAFKNGQTELDLVLGGLADSALKASPFFNEIEMLVPVPLHWRKRFIRGYNQSYLLAKWLKHPFAKVSADLARIRYTKPQPDMLTPTARARNVEGAFAVRYRHQFADKKICLVDDIKTTGATLNECAKTLKGAGASKVFALVLAVAGQNAA